MHCIAFRGKRRVRLYGGELLTGGSPRIQGLYTPFPSPAGYVSRSAGNMRHDLASKGRCDCTKRIGSIVNGYSLSNGHLGEGGG